MLSYALVVAPLLLLASHVEADGPPLDQLLPVPDSAAPEPGDGCWDLWAAPPLLSPDRDMQQQAREQAFNDWIDLQVFVRDAVFGDTEEATALFGVDYESLNTSDIQLITQHGETVTFDAHKTRVGEGSVNLQLDNGIVLDGILLMDGHLLAATQHGIDLHAEIVVWAYTWTHDDGVEIGAKAMVVDARYIVPDPGLRGLTECELDAFEDYEFELKECRRARDMCRAAAGIIFAAEMALCTLIATTAALPALAGGPIGIGAITLALLACKAEAAAHYAAGLAVCQLMYDGCKASEERRLAHEMAQCRRKDANGVTP